MLVYTPPRQSIHLNPSRHPFTHPPIHHQALEARPADTTAHVLLGTVLAESDRAAVVAAYRRLVPALAAKAKDGGRSSGGYHRAAHRLAVLTGEGPSAVVGAAPGYVREVFDAMAEEFEAKLVDHLGYRVRVHACMGWLCLALLC